MLADTNDRPGLDERYIGATNSSDLRLNPDATCDATHLIAAGLIGNRMGAALIHLRAEWDAADKPRKATEAEILARAEELPKRKGKVDVKRARTEMLVGYSVAMRHRAHSMRGWLPALSIMAEWAQIRGWDVDLLSPALYHWLNPVCPVCDGLGARKMEDAPVLGKKCHHCEGSGVWPKPLGSHKVKEWLARCAGKAKGQRGGVLRGDMEPDPLAARLRQGYVPEEELTEEQRAQIAERFKLR
jgi:hypothetical protein